MTLSAGAILFHVDDGVLRVLIGHMGGPFWSRKDDHAWSIPKGICEPGEDTRAAAAREFGEEMGSPLPDGDVLDLGTITASSSKMIAAYAVEGDLDAAAVVSNTFEMEWPPRSGTTASFPEIDRAAWVDSATARTKLVKGQVPLVDRLVDELRGRGVDVV